MPGRGSETDPNDWYRIAREDFEVARRLLDERSLRWAWVTLEQAAEKLIKGRLIELGTRPPRSHRLPDLMRLLPEQDQDKEFLKESAELLSEEYLASRYPGASADAEPTVEELESAVEATRRLGEKLAPQHFLKA